MVCTFRVVRFVQLVACKAQEDVAMRKNGLAGPRQQSMVLRIVVLGLLIDKRLRFVGGVLVILRFPSCTYGV